MIFAAPINRVARAGALFVGVLVLVTWTATASPAYRQTLMVTKTRKGGRVKGKRKSKRGSKRGKRK